MAELAAVVDGKPFESNSSRIDLENLAREYRTQKIVFETARDIYDQMQPTWPGNREYLIAQLVRLVEEFIRTDKILIVPALFYQEDLRRRLLITLNMTKLVQHIWEAIRFENTEKLEPVFDRDRPIRSTADMTTWYTGKPCAYTARSHINSCVYDSTWEASEAFELDHNPAVDSWVKNDHLGFEVLYVYRGVVRKYRPDFLIRLKSGDMLVLETKGRTTSGTGPSADSSASGHGRSTCTAALAVGRGPYPETRATSRTFCIKRRQATSGCLPRRWAPRPASAPDHTLRYRPHPPGNPVTLRHPRLRSGVSGRRRVGLGPAGRWRELPSSRHLSLTTIAHTRLPNKTPPAGT